MQHWYRTTPSWLSYLLLPFSWLFRLIVAIRYFLYQFNIKKKIHFNIPVIIVGNITVGGTGKTPFVIWLAKILQEKGYHPGIVSRGVGGKKLLRPHWIDANADPKWAGDEAVLLAKRTGCPMVACIDRVAAVKELLQKTNCDIVISDDGLQHYRLGRDVEIVIVDGVRKFGNNQMLPAGPLREPIKRLKQVDLVVVNGNHKILEKQETMHLQGDTLFSVLPSNKTILLQDFQGKTVHAIAGIGNPERFFSSLEKNQINVIPHIFPDHYSYQRDDIYFADNLPVIMTEKDAVKCHEFADQRHWYLPVQAEMSHGITEKIFSLINIRKANAHN